MNFSFSNEAQDKFKKLFYGIILACFHLAILFFLYNSIVGTQHGSLLLGITGILLSLLVLVFFRLICEGLTALPKIAQKLELISAKIDPPEASQ